MAGEARRWEYSVFSVDLSEGPTLEAQLNEMGAAGWELVHVDAYARGAFLVGVVMKREREHG